MKFISLNRKSFEIYRGARMIKLLAAVERSGMPELRSSMVEKLAKELFDAAINLGVI